VSRSYASNFTSLSAPIKCLQGKSITPFIRKNIFQQLTKALLKIAVNEGMGLPFTKKSIENQLC
jgi:hypothetical protein